MKDLPSCPGGAPHPPGRLCKHSALRAHALGVKVTKRCLQGMGTCFVKSRGWLQPVSLPGPAQPPAGRSRLPNGDAAGREPVVEVFKAKVRKGLTQPFQDLELFS